MLYSFHHTDLEPGLPRVLPYPLSSTARYLRPDEMPEDTRDFLVAEGADPNNPKGRWVIIFWDERVPREPVAKAVVCWSHGEAVTEALWVMSLYGPINIERYLTDLGSRLWAN